jgi:hypothetical protein
MYSAGKNFYEYKVASRRGKGFSAHYANRTATKVRPCRAKLPGNGVFALTCVARPTSCRTPVRCVRSKSLCRLSELDSHKIFPPLILILVLSASLLYVGGYASISSAGDAPYLLDERARELGLQTELPGAVKQMEAMEPLFWRLPRFGISSDAATFLLYFSLAMIFILLFVHLRFAPWSASRSLKLAPDGRLGASAVPLSERAARMDHAQEEADALAAAGDFAGAMHVLLLQSVGELRRSLGVPIAESLTSREILKSAPISPEERSALAEIVSGVEISYFGDYRPGVGEYEACRRSFESLKGFLRLGGAP